MLFWYEIFIYLVPKFYISDHERSSLLHVCSRTFREILMCLSRMISCVYITDDPLIIQSVGHILKRRCIYMHGRFLTSLQKLTGCIQTVEIQKEIYSNWTHGSYEVFDGFWFHLCLFASELGQIFPPMVRSEHRSSKIQRPGEQKKEHLQTRANLFQKLVKNLSPQLQCTQRIHSHATEERTSLCCHFPQFGAGCGGNLSARSVGLAAGISP